MTGNASSIGLPMVRTRAGTEQIGYRIPRGDVRAFADAMLPLLKVPFEGAGIRAFACGFMRASLGKGLEGILL